MDATQATAEATNSQGSEAEQASRSLENDGVTTHENSQQGGQSPGGEGGDGGAHSPSEPSLSEIDSPEALERFTSSLLEGEDIGDEARAGGGEGEVQTDPEPEPAPDPNPAPAPKPPGDDDDDDDDAPLDPANLKTRFRLKVREDDAVGKLAGALKHRNKDWTLEEAVAVARKQLNLAPAKTSESEGTPAQPEATGKPVETAAQTTPAADDLAQINAEISGLRAKKREAMRNVEMDETAALEEQLDALIDQRLEARVQLISAQREVQTRQADQQASAYDQAFDTSMGKASALYPFVQDSDSPAAKRMQEIDRMLDANDDPLFHSPDKPMKLAQMVAAELAIAPSAVVAQTGKPPAKPASAAPRYQPAARNLAPIASGDSRTSTTRTESAQVMSKISAIDSIDDLESFVGVDPDRL